jgi:hypothetical protein
VLKSLAGLWLNAWLSHYCGLGITVIAGLTRNLYGKAAKQTN